MIEAHLIFIVWSAALYVTHRPDSGVWKARFVAWIIRVLVTLTYAQSKPSENLDGILCRLSTSHVCHRFPNQQWIDIAVDYVRIKHSRELDFCTRFVWNAFNRLGDFDLGKNVQKCINEGLSTTICIYDTGYLSRIHISHLVQSNPISR